jgi:hypothetical protein
VLIDKGLEEHAVRARDALGEPACARRVEERGHSRCDARTLEEVEGAELPALVLLHELDRADRVQALARTVGALAGERELGPARRPIERAVEEEAIRFETRARETSPALDVLAQARDERRHAEQRRALLVRVALDRERLVLHVRALAGSGETRAELLEEGQGGARRARS